MAYKQLSPAQTIAYSKLLFAFEESLVQNRGVKIQVPSEQAALLKRAFYQCKASDERYSELSLLATKDPSIFLIYHNQKEIPNG